MTHVFSYDSHPVHYADSASAARTGGRHVTELPYVIRVLLENLTRHRSWGGPVSESEVQAVLDWQHRSGADLPLHVTRVILPDSSGLPVLQDLAALRDAVALQG